METGFIALNIFLICAFSFVMLPSIIKTLKLNRAKFITPIKHPDIRYGRYYIYFFTCICVLIVIIFAKGFDTDRDPDLVIERAEKEGIYEHQYWAYYQKLKKNPYDYRSMYYFHKSHHESENGRKFWDRKDYMWGISVPAGWEYDDISKSKDLRERDRGFFGAAVAQFIYYQNSGETLRLLDSLHYKNMPFENCLRAMCVEATSEKAYYTLKEIAGKGYANEAIRYFAEYCYYNQDYEYFEKIYAESAFRFFIPAYIKQEYAFLNNQLLNYQLYEVERIFRNTNLFAIFCILFIFYIWMFFLYNIDLYEKEKYKNIVFAFALSTLTFFLTSFLYDFFHHYLHLRKNGEPMNDLIYCIFEIGFIEEFVKILPLLIILRFTKILNEPVDYLLYGGIGALTFSILEDFLYFNNSSVIDLFARGIFTNIGHIADTSFIAYSLVLSRFYYKKYTIPLFIGGFLLACVCHGLYDFFIINETYSFWIIPSLILLLQVWWFVHIVTNCLNNSLHFNPRIMLNTRYLSTVVCGGLFVLTIVVYVHSAFNISPEYATWNLFMAVAYYSYILFFFSVCINRIDIFNGEWVTFSLKQFVNPKVFFAGINHKYSSLPGRKITLIPYGKQTKNMTGSLPLICAIDKRVKIDGYTGWFVITLDFPINVRGRFFSTLLFRTTENNDALEPDHRNCIEVFVPKTNGTPPESYTRQDILHLDRAGLVIRGEI